MTGQALNEADETLAMAYADGELDPIEARRFEQRMALEPALEWAVSMHRALGAQLRAGFATVAAEPLPERLTATIPGNVVQFPARNAAPRWRIAAAMAACLVVGLLLGRIGPQGPVMVADGRLAASGTLADALESRLAGEAGDIRIVASFRDGAGSYCRVFTAPVTDGIACRDAEGWALRRTASATATQAATGGYRQAGSAAPSLMAAAQEMMVGDPLDGAGEAKARGRGWK
jgi:hypothetical protein